MALTSECDRTAKVVLKKARSLVNQYLSLLITYLIKSFLLVEGTLCLENQKLTLIHFY